jgi:hypothetical protein
MPEHLGPGSMQPMTPVCNVTHAVTALRRFKEAALEVTCLRQFSSLDVPA